MGGGGHKQAHPPHRHWAWRDWTGYGAFVGYDWPAIRRGRQVYTEVFAPCHSLTSLTFNHFQAFMTKEEIRALAETYEITDPEPDRGTGAYIVRKGRSTDPLPKPFPNQAAAAASNNGAVPPDLRLATYSFEGGEDYIFSLLTGYKWGEYMEIPPWLNIKPGQFFNPYFKGCVLSMPPPLSDGLLDYEDGTPATVSQMAKDVVSFLKWVSDPDHEEKRIHWARATTTAILMNIGIQHWCARQVNWRAFLRVNYRYWKKPY